MNNEQILAIDIKLAKLSTLNCRYLVRRNFIEISIKASAYFADLKALTSYQNLINSEIENLQIIAQEIGAIIQY